MRANKLRFLTIVTVSVLGACGLVACSKDEKKPATQVAAKVNSQEISVHQVNFVLQRSGANAQTPEQSAALRKAALERLIDQSVVVDEAVEKKLDRQPDVILALELARREVLSRALLEQMAAAAAKPSEEEARQYYKANPALFAERRIYSVQELVVAAASDVAKPIKDMVAANKTMEEIAAFLKGRNIQYAGGGAQRTAEQIPLEILPRIHALKDGQSTVLETPQAITVLRVVQSQSQPVNEAQALPRIVQFLANQRNQEAAAKEVKRLRDKAKISYEGDFGKAAAAPAATPAAATPAIPSITTPAAPAPAKGDVPATGSDANMEKGIRGLK